MRARAFAVLATIAFSGCIHTGPTYFRVDDRSGHAVVLHATLADGSGRIVVNETFALADASGLERNVTLGRGDFTVAAWTDDGILLRESHGVGAGFGIFLTVESDQIRMSSLHGD